MLEGFNSWFLDPHNAPKVAYLGLWMGLIALAATISGLYLTYRQARAAKENSEAATTAAEAARGAVENFKFRVAQYDISRDLSEAQYALDTTRRHLTKGAWSDAGDSYEDARRAVIRIDLSCEGLSEKDREQLQKAARQMADFCKKIDAASAQKGDYPDETKALAVIRKNYELLAGIQKRILEAV